MVRGPNVRPSGRVHAVAPFPVIEPGNRLYRSELAGSALFPFDWFAAIFTVWGDVAEGEGFGGGMFRAFGGFASARRGFAFRHRHLRK